MLALRKAKPTDLSILQHWDQQAHVIASDPDDDWEWELELSRDPEWREQLIAHIDGRPVGFIQIIDPYREESHYWGQVSTNLRAVDIWIGEADDLGKGYGTRMMQLAIARCFAHPEVMAILIDPLATNVKAHRFYERLGFAFVEERRFHTQLCHVYRLEREKWSKLSMSAP